MSTTMREWRQAQTANIHRDAVPTPRSLPGQIEAAVGLALGMTAARFERAIERGPTEAIRRHWRAEHAAFIAELRTPLLEPLGLKGLVELKGGKDFQACKEAIMDTTATAISLADVLRRFPVESFPDDDYGALRITNVIAGKDYRPHHVYRTGEVADPTVVAQGVTFPSAPVAAEIAAATITVEKLPQTLTVSMEVVQNDDNQRVAREVRTHVRAYWRKMHRSIINLLNTNALYGDGLPLFHATHGNLLTGAALDIPTARTAYLTLRSLLPYGGTDAMPPTGRVVLLVPPALEVAARQVVEAEGSLGGLHGVPDLVVCPLLTSATKWFMALQAPQFPTVELEYLDSLEPQIFRQGSQAADQLFRADQFEFAIKHTYKAAIVATEYIVMNPGA